MEATGLSDVEVLDDLLNDVEEDEVDAEFFDTDAVEGDQGGDLTAEGILSQLDAVTNLDDDDVHGEEFHDSTSMPESETNAGGIVDEVERRNESLSEELPSGVDIVDAVLDLAASSDDAGPPQEEPGNAHTAVQEEPEHKNLSPKADVELPKQEQFSLKETDAVNSEIAGASAECQASSNMVKDTSIASLDDETIPPPANLPPPAPVSIPVVTGTMNPVEDDNDSDDSLGEEDDESVSITPPLRLNDSDDDEDVLEVDAAVVSTLQVEGKQQRTLTVEQQSRSTKAVDSNDSAADNALLKALPATKTEGFIDVSLQEEVRVAHVTTLEPSGTFSDLHKVVGGSSSPDAFGISYQSMRKQNDGAHSVDDVGDDGGYTLPSGPAFPDEREFEKELELSTDLTFSVATNASEYPGRGDEASADGEDDEFVFDIQPTADPSKMAGEEIQLRRKSYEDKERKEEEKILNEIKRATDQEKQLIENTNESDHLDVAISYSSIAAADSEMLSVTELHSIYKRGLGDQGVLLDDDKNSPLSKSGGDQGTSVSRSLSVMGRILSKPYGTETIEEGEEEEEGNESAEKGDRKHELSDVDIHKSPKQRSLEQDEVAEPSEWREIKLMQHSRSQEIESQESRLQVNPDTGLVSQITYAEAAGYYAETPDVMQHRDAIVPEDVPRSSCLGCLSRPRLTFPGAIDERDRVFCIAATAFDSYNDVVVKVLQTIYRKLVKNPRDVPLIGRHWEDIGFQGSDPSTDLRGCGVFSLLQMLYLLETHAELAHRFYALSQHPTRHFPFACALINITLQCVVALRSGALYSECNKHLSVLSGMNKLYIAITFHLNDAIQSRNEEIPLVMKDVLDRGRATPGKAIDDAFNGTALRLVRSGSTSTGLTKSVVERKESDDNLLFTEIGMHAVGED